MTPNTVMPIRSTQLNENLYYFKDKTIKKKLNNTIGYFGHFAPKKELINK